jgi:hypothetical protein
MIAISSFMIKELRLPSDTTAKGGEFVSIPNEAKRGRRNAWKKTELVDTDKPRTWVSGRWKRVGQNASHTGL